MKDGHLVSSGRTVVIPVFKALGFKLQSIMQHIAGKRWWIFNDIWIKFNGVFSCKWLFDTCCSGLCILTCNKIWENFCKYLLARWDRNNDPVIFAALHSNKLTSRNGHLNEVAAYIQGSCNEVLMLIFVEDFRIIKWFIHAIKQSEFQERIANVFCVIYSNYLY